MITVYIVDDHPILRKGLAGLLSVEEDIEVVGSADNGEDAITDVMDLHPDVILMDLRLPGMSGSEATEQILRQGADHPEWTPRIVILTTYEDDNSITTAIEAGATGYLLKSATPDEIITAVREISAGRTVLAPSVASALVHHIKEDALAHSLSPRENDVLVLLAQGMSNTEIASTLYVETSTVKTHIEHIFTKLGISRRTQAIARAHDMGLV